MKKIIILTICFIACYGSVKSQEVKLGKSSVDEVLKAMTIEEKVQLLIGTGMAGASGSSAVVGATQSLVPGAAGTTNLISRLGIPAIVLADGPAGLRISPKREGSSDTYYCTAFPVATLLAATWNCELTENVGLAMGNEVLEYGADVLLGPALNIHRNPLCGRNFEYYSEDPLLSGKTAAAIIRGIQKNGVGTSIKHFAANNQESNRMANDARMTERALREIYLKGFEIAVKESNPWTVMSSYNFINGVYASESRELLTTILHDEWGFKGTVMTDWFGGRNAAAQVYAGNDLLMPGRPDQYNAILQAVNDGKLSIQDVDINVKRILNLILESPRFKNYKYSNKPDLKAHAQITRQSAAEGIILLKNTATLPITSKTKKIATFGITSYDFISGGTGSGDVNEAYTISLGEGLVNAGYQINEELKSLYLKYINEENEKNKPDPNNPFAAFMPKIRAGEFVPEADILNKTAKETDVALITIGRTSGEFMDRKLDNDFNLSDNEQKLIQEVSKVFHAAGKKVVVILNIGGVIETASWKQYPDAIVLAWQAGQEGGNSVADILSGKINPSGKLPMTFPVNYTDNISSANFPQDYTPGPMNFGGNTNNAEKPKVRNIDFTYYEEDIFVGYRYFDSFNKDVSYPFGYGLSYTTFEYINPKINQNGNEYTISLTVKNTGKTTGKEVVQLYVAAPKNQNLTKPDKELKAFAKTKELKAGESQTIELSVKILDLASFDEDESAWVADAGEYQLLIASSSKDIKSTLSLAITNKVSEKTHNVMNPQEKINTIKK
ncbi:MAG: glycoside hydrolase family 3 C-terminal domain-containing protein [Prevotellaceae bacterium]|jgi:beta-glucosidase|nr:glycoside hydrolase family 3 C-terminal domain-containing protein [Prevotellaceae bacterium]